MQKYYNTKQQNIEEVFIGSQREWKQTLGQKGARQKDREERKKDYLKLLTCRQIANRSI